MNRLLKQNSFDLLAVKYLQKIEARVDSANLKKAGELFLNDTERVVEAIIEVWNRRNEIGGYRLTYQAPFLRHFTARFEPLARE